MAKNKVVIWAIAGVAVGCTLGLLQRWNPMYLRLPDGRIVPPWGLAVNPNAHKPGRPEVVESHFRAIYQSICAFRERNGRLPYAPAELLAFEKKTQRGTLTESDLISPDVADSNEYASGMRDHLGYVFDLRGLRPDGRPKPTFPKATEKDAWVSTNVYVRANSVVYPDRTATSEFVGFFIVLWSDGSVERIPAGEQLWVSTQSGLEGHYPGQAGMPTTAMRASWLGARYNSAAPASVPGGPVR